MLTKPQISAHNAYMRRKSGQLIPIEQSILVAAVRLRGQGIEEFHGFGIAKEIRDREGARLLTGHGTLYRALGRLEEQGFLIGRWEDPLVAAEENRPRRKLYKFTGAEVPLLGDSSTRPARLQLLRETAP